MSKHQNPFNVRGAATKQPDAHTNEVVAFHNRDDVDESDVAHHHTLGFKAGQAAPGTKVQQLLDAIANGAFGRVGDIQYADLTTETAIWKKANGQLLNIADYPEAYAVWGVTHGGDGITTFGLPDLRDRVTAGLRAGSTYFASIGTKAGVTTADYAHSHTTPAHNHTGPSHSHTISDDGAHAHGGTTGNFNHTQATNTTTTGGGNRLTSPVGHDHTITSGGSHNHGGATGTDGIGATGNASPSTNGTTYTAPTVAGTVFHLLQPYYVSQPFVRVKLGI
jgi:microcystin-dependent protein